jgi:hypothetical protein
MKTIRAQVDSIPPMTQGKHAFGPFPSGAFRIIGPVDGIQRHDGFLERLSDPLFPKRQQTATGSESAIADFQIHPAQYRRQWKTQCSFGLFDFFFRHRWMDPFLLGNIHHYGFYLAGFREITGNSCLLQHPLLPFGDFHTVHFSRISSRFPFDSTGGFAEGPSSFT